MKQIEVTDEWLCKYMPIVGEAIIRELEEGTDYPTRHSKHSPGIVSTHQT